MGKIILILIFIMLLGCSKETEKFEIEVKGDVPIFKSHEDSAFLTERDRQEKSIATVKAGEKIEIIGSIYGKDYLAYKVKTSTGVEGFVIHGDKFDVTKNTRII